MAGVKGQATANPSQLKSPVPKTAPVGAAPAGVGEDPYAELSGFDDYSELDALGEAGAGAPASVGQETQEQQGLGGQILDGAGRVLDYAGGNVRTGLATAAGMVQAAAQGKNPLEQKVTTDADVKNALKGNAPDSAEYLTRLGLPELGNIDVPMLGKVTGRGVVGFISDIATDPLTSISKLAKEYPMIKKLLMTPGAASEALGEAVYKSALKKIDGKLVQKHGLEAGEGVANELVKAGAPVGNTARLAEKVEDISSAMGKLRQGLYDQATAKGVSIDLGYPLKRTEALIAKLRANPNTEPAADMAEELMSRFKARGQVDIPTLSEWKSSLYQAIPKKEWEVSPSMRPIAKMIKSELAHDFNTLITAAGNKAEKGLGDSIAAVNNRWGPLLSARDPLAKQIAKDSFDAIGSQIDHTILSLGGVTKYVQKKALDALTTTTGRTVVGRALMEAGKQGVANRAFIDAARKAQQAPPEEPVQ